MNYEMKMKKKTKGFFVSQENINKKRKSLKKKRKRMEKNGKKKE